MSEKCVTVQCKQRRTGKRLLLLLLVMVFAVEGK